MENKDSNLMEKIVSLAKRRGFIFPGSEIYGGLSNSFDYGPLGVELKNNIKNLWWKNFVQRRDDMVGIDAALIMNPKVWEASGHLKEFSDPLVECSKCKKRFRADQIENKGGFQYCPDDNEILGPPRRFNLMLKTFLGPVDPINNLWQGSQTNKDRDDLSIQFFLETKIATVYFRPETAQAMFVDFKNVLETSRKRLPFGIAQIGKAFRNEINPGNFIFRTREFEQMEIEYFIEESNWKKVFEYWQKEMWSWMTDILGLKKGSIHELEVPADELAHYSKRTIDFEFDYPFGTKELYGLAYRTDFDLKNHYKEPPYADEETGEKFYPHVIEPTFGVERTILALLCDTYTEEEERVVLKLKPALAPYKAAVFPLLRNKPELVKKAREVYNMLKADFTTAFDDRGNIGKRYFSQDEIGTPFAVTIDFTTLEDDTVTIRDRDTMKQERIKISGLQEKIYHSIHE